MGHGSHQILKRNSGLDGRTCGGTGAKYVHTSILPTSTPERSMRSSYHRSPVMSHRPRGSGRQRSAAPFRPISTLPPDSPPPRFPLSPVPRLSSSPPRRLPVSSIPRRYASSNPGDLLSAADRSRISLLSPTPLPAPASRTGCCGAPRRSWSRGRVRGRSSCRPRAAAACG